MKEKISIIIPVYNGERFIDECLESILCQTYSNFEIIIVDDGSTDNSFKIIDKYRKDNKCIKAYHQKNQGVSSARNYGIKVATGSYITFVDIDDTIACDFLEKLMCNIKDNDILVSGYKRIDENGVIIGENLPKDNPWNEMKLCNIAGKMYKKNFIIDNNIEFSNQKYAEDLNFYLQGYTNTEKIVFYSYAGYNYRRVIGSATSNIVARDVDECITSIYLTDKLFLNGKVKRLDDPSTKKMIMFLYQKTIPFFIITKRKLVDYKELVRETKEAFLFLEKVYRQHGTKVKFRYQKYEQLSINIAINVFVFCYKFHLLTPFLWFLNKV